MLKTKLLQDGKDIYYLEKKGARRSISINEAAAIVMTNEKDQVRENLKVIISLRNLTTHSIIPKFDIIYSPFMGFDVQAYADKMYDYFNINISEYIKNDLLSLFVNNRSVNKQDILSKYGVGITTLFEEKETELLNAITNNGDNSIASKVEITFIELVTKVRWITYFISLITENKDKVINLNKKVNPRSKGIST